MDTDQSLRIGIVIETETRHEQWKEAWKQQQQDCFAIHARSIRQLLVLLRRSSQGCGRRLHQNPKPQGTNRKSRGNLGKMRRRSNLLLRRAGGHGHGRPCILSEHESKRKRKR